MTSLYSPHDVFTGVEGVGHRGADDTGVVLLSREVGARVDHVRLVGGLVQPAAFVLFEVRVD